MENNKYAPQIGIKGQTTFNGCGWSIICYNYEKTSDYTTRSYLRFLNYERAPNILAKGTMFELYEGRKLVAKYIRNKNRLNYIYLCKVLFTLKSLKIY